MPRYGLNILALALCLAACDQAQAPQAGPSAAPAAAASDQVQPAPRSAAPPGFAGAPYAASRTFFKLQDHYPPAWFLCDGIDRPAAMIVGLPDAASNITIISLDKANPGHHSQASFRLGQPDPGAGQVYWPLTTGGGAEAGYLRAFNPGMIEDPASATTATFTEIKIGETTTSCRWRPGILLEALGARRSYLVTREAGQLVYRTFNYAQAAAAQPLPDSGPARTTPPSLEIRGGTETTTPTGRLYVFENNSYRYTVEIGADHRGAVMVVKAGRQVAAEPFQAYTIAK
jgi:hypothetical protein